MAQRLAPSKLASLLQGVEAAHPGGRLRQLWREVVGPRVAARSEAGWLKGDVLTVKVASPVWAQELALLSEPILARLNEAGVKVKQLRFRVVDLGRPGQPVKAKARRPAPTMPRAELPKELVAHLESVEDPELRARIKEAAELTLARKSKRR
ncbi:MAG: DUF721 domain-containing protein [Polyangiaceae bacterium]|nr:DUF721 domain-containing protein [Polyangiaceae bacterium]MCB9607000.1 DUF721 domain-containing protein [Polyangiaceae bacterium]